jgi:cytidylate kinase
VSAIAEVRRVLLDQQRRVARRGSVVVVGRDIGTVVLPEAELKIYLDASDEERARRRHRELLARGVAADYDAVLSNVRERDRIDSGRAVAPLKPASDSHIVDTTGIGVDEVLRRVMDLACGDEAGDEKT